MVSFNIKAGVLHNILKLVQAEGKTVKGEKKPMLTDCIIHAEKDNTFIRAIDGDEVLIVNIAIKLGKESVKDAGDIPVEFEDAIKTLGRFNAADNVEISYEDNLIRFKRNKPKLDVKLPVVAVDSIKSAMQTEIPFIFDAKTKVWKAGDDTLLDTSITLDAKEFKEVVEDGDQIQHRNFPFTVTKNELTVIVEDVDSGSQITREIITKEIKTSKNIASLYSYGFGNAFANLSGEIKIWLCNEGPMAIMQETEDYALIYILATTELEEEDDSNENESTPEGEGDATEDKSLESQVDDAVNEDQQQGEEPQNEDQVEPEPEIEKEKAEEPKKKATSNGKKTSKKS